MIFIASGVESLSRSLGRWEIAEYVCAGLVAVACAGEYIADFTDWFTCGVKEKKDRLAKRSTLLLIASLALELVCLVKTNSLSGRLVGSLSEKAAAADTKAQSALEASGKAQDKADVVAKQADALKTRMEVATGQMGQLEKKIADQGPRAKLLTKVAPDLARKLAPFAGQRVGLFVCGQQGLADQETLDAWGVIANILDSDTVSGVTGAKWKEVPTNLNFAGGCGAAKGLGQGLIVFVSKRASRSTMEAAIVLGHGLAKALPPSPNKIPSLIDPDFAKMLVDRGLRDKNAPWVLPGLDPDLITVLIGEHP
jgi:hypothetical protein